MKRAARRVLGVALAVAVTLAIVALSRLPYAAADGEGALIRFSWRTPGAQVDECRRLSAEELERLPVHMRREEVCERRILPYRLQVRLDGRTVYDELVRASGAREDRPLFVFRELPVAPGEYRLEVRWERERNGVSGSGDDDAHEATEAAEEHERREAHDSAPRPAPRRTTPENLELKAVLRLDAGDVSLVTYDLDHQRLVVRGRGAVDGTVSRAGD